MLCHYAVSVYLDERQLPHQLVAVGAQLLTDGIRVNVLSLLDFLLEKALETIHNRFLSFCLLLHQGYLRAMLR